MPAERHNLPGRALKACGIVGPCDTSANRLIQVHRRLTPGETPCRSRCRFAVVAASRPGGEAGETDDKLVGRRMAAAGFRLVVDHAQGLEDVPTGVVLQERKCNLVETLSSAALRVTRAAT